MLVLHGLLASSPPLLASSPPLLARRYYPYSAMTTNVFELDHEAESNAQDHRKKLKRERTQGPKVLDRILFAKEEATLLI